MGVKSNEQGTPEEAEQLLQRGGERTEATSSGPSQKRDDDIKANDKVEIAKNPRENPPLPAAAPAKIAKTKAFLALNTRSFSSSLLRSTFDSIPDPYSSVCSSTSTTPANPPPDTMSARAKLHRMTPFTQKRGPSSDVTGSKTSKEKTSTSIELSAKASTAKGLVASTSKNIGEKVKMFRSNSDSKRIREGAKRQKFRNFSLRNRKMAWDEVSASHTELLLKLLSICVNNESQSSELV